MRFKYVALTLLFISGLVALPLSQAKAADPLAPEKLAAFQKIEANIQKLVDQAQGELDKLADLPVVKDSLGKLPVYYDKEAVTIKAAELTVHGKLLYDEFLAVHKRNPGFGFVFMGASDGGFVQAPDNDTVGPRYDPRNRPWYGPGMNAAHNFNISRTYISTSGDVVVSVNRKVFAGQGQPLGLLGIDIELGDIIAEVNNLLEGGDSYAVIVDKETGDLISLAGQANPAIIMNYEGRQALRPVFHMDQGLEKVKLDDKFRDVSIYSSSLLDWKIALISASGR